MPRRNHLLAAALLALGLLATASSVFAAADRPATYSIRMDEVRIPLPDGVRLAADLYMPAGGAAGERHPVLLEYLPYRKTEARGAQLPALLVLRPARLRGRRRRHSRHRQQRGPADPVRVLRHRAAGRRSRDRLAVEAALVERQRRACSASPGAGSTRSRWRCATRRRSRRSSPSMRPRTSTRRTCTSSTGSCTSIPGR